MSTRDSKFEATNRPFITTVLSIALDLLLWTWLFVFSAGVIWTLVLEGTWEDYGWLLAIGALLTLFAIIGRRRKRRAMIRNGQAALLEQIDMQDGSARHRWVRQAFPSLETLVWVCLAVVVSTTGWTINTGQGVTVTGMVWIGAAVFAALVIGRLGLMWASRGTKDD